MFAPLETKDNNYHQGILGNKCYWAYKVQSKERLSIQFVFLQGFPDPLPLCSWPSEPSLSSLLNISAILFSESFFFLT